jgi:hypothetical protein
MVKPEVEKHPRRECSEKELEALSDGLSRAARVPLRGPAANVSTLGERPWESGEVVSQENDLEKRRDMQAIGPRNVGPWT